MDTIYLSISYGYVLLIYFITKSWKSGKNKTRGRGWGWWWGWGLFTANCMFTTSKRKSNVWFLKAELLQARSTMGKKIWLSMHSRNFGSEKIASTYVSPLIHLRGYEMSHLLAGSPRHAYTVSVFNLVLDIYAMDLWQLSRNGICWPVPLDCIASSGTQRIEVT